jgi:hypothetical protein
MVSAMPLRALLDGKDFYSEDLTDANRKNIFICPTCKMQFIIVLPLKNRIKHFRHQKGGATHYEPETIIKSKTKQNDGDYFYYAHF